MVTAELAVAIPTLVLVLFVALSALTTVLDQVRCVDAARATARALARGDDQGSALATGRALSPAGASFVVSGGGPGGEVSVVVRGHPTPGLAWVGDRASPTGRAVAVMEDADPEDPSAADLGPEDTSAEDAGTEDTSAEATAGKAGRR